MNKSMIKYAAVATFSAALALLLGLWLSPDTVGIVGGKRPVRAQANSVELIRDVRVILNLVSVYADYEEYFSERDSKVTSGILDKLGFGKKAMLRVKGKVTMGYAFDEKDIVVNEAERRMVLMASSEPSILSIEHDVDYIDLDQGLFNRFKKEDITAINARGKERIREKAAKSDLFARARAQRNEAIGVVRGLAESNGWSFSVDTTGTPFKGFAVR